MEMTYINEPAMLEFASQFAKQLSAPLVIYLQGDLGAGKTTFTRGVIKSLGYQGLVKSPTYTLVENYSFPQFIIYHLDLYRLAEPDELDYIGFRDYLNSRSIIMVEWPEKGIGFLPCSDITIEFNVLDEGRSVTVTSQTEQGHNMLKKL